jgi:predicted transcriptional regulator
VKVEDVMSTNLIVGYVPGTVRDALRTLAKNNKSGMPILKKDTKTVVGIVTRTDIFKNQDEDQIALIMTEDFHSVNGDQNVKDAARLLYEKRIHGLPVVNQRSHLVGIISPTDILKHIPEKIDKKIEDFFTNLVVPVYHDTPINIINWDY